MELFSILFLLTTPIYGFSIYLFLSPASTKKTPLSTIITVFLLYMVLQIFLYIENIPPVILLVTNIISFFFLSKMFKSTFGEQILTTIVISSVLMLAETIGSILIGQVDYFSLDRNQYQSELCIVLVRTFSFLSSYIYWKLYHFQTHEYLLPQRYYYSQALVLFGVFYLYFSTITNHTTTKILFMINTFVFFSITLLMLYTSEKLYHSVVIQARHKILEQENLALLNQQELVEQSLHSISALRHDMKNQLLSLSYLQNTQQNEQVQQLTEKIILDMEDSQPLAKSNHYMIDSILNFKLQQIDRNQTSLHLNLKIPSDLPILVYDLTVILGNLLDNAITGLNTIEDEKFLSISITVSHGMLIILIENSFDGVLKEKNGKYISTKPMGANHGFGLENVENVVERLDGEMSIKATSKTFRVEALLPLSNQ